MVLPSRQIAKPAHVALDGFAAPTKPQL